MPKVETFDKEVVINNALNIFHSKGYNLTSMQDLVDATGLNRSSIYNSFGSKLDLYKLCLKTYQKSSKEFLEDSICSSNCAISVLETIFKIGVSSDKDYLEKGCLFNSCASEMANQEPTIHSYLLNNQQQMITLFEDIVADGQNKSLINTNKTTNEYALYLLNAFQGLRISGILTNDEQKLENIVNTTLSILK